jgi:hypothetical protein
MITADAAHRCELRRISGPVWCRAQSGEVPMLQAAGDSLISAMLQPKRRTIRVHGSQHDGLIQAVLAEASCESFLLA